MSIDGSTPVSITARLDTFARVVLINTFALLRSPQWFDQDVIDYDFAIREEAFGEVEIFEDILVEEDAPLMHRISEPDLTAIKLFAE
ncbi:hypothetical protein JMF97_12615 [Micromonospora fiedleri]|uniref:Uncharacterized protein n=1 Tax=Micromonospora fiedleri TaxID=1157498 RepID=A0ABS1UKZ9_9ACTN|nr:hypothetical protein [Micromonospora fiedleri]MBL6277005.1 hypothetical protein [Micromonospora fiedleri]